jgi:hypothetical protein
MNTNEVLKTGLRAAGEAQRLGLRVAGPAIGFYKRVQSARRKDLPDPAITRKVESIVFRDSRFPKSSIVVNTVDGVVYLRGTLKQAAAIKALEAAVRKVPEVKDVENLVTQPKTPKKAPKGRFKKPGEKPVRRGKLSDDRTDEIVDVEEPSPKQKAAKREGRTPAPVGARDDTPSASGSGSGETGGAPGAGSTPTPTV